MLSFLEKEDDFRDQVLKWVELIFPSMERLNTEKQRLDGYTVITIKEQDTRTHFPAKLISDSTIYELRIITTIFRQSSEMGITIIEEPERCIHPNAINELIGLMREQAAAGHPIFLITHSESVVRSWEVEGLHFVSKNEGKTKLLAEVQSVVDKNMIPLDMA